MAFVLRRNVVVTRSFARSLSSADGSSLHKSFVRSVKSNMNFEEKPIIKDDFGKRSKPSEDPKPTVKANMTHDVSPEPTPILSGREAVINAQSHLNLQEFAPRITVIGVGGGGCNAINNMIARGLGGVDFVCANTDAQHLSTTLAEKKIQLGRSSTQGLGCGANPDSGRAAALESRDQILEMIGDAHMVFITAGMGGGTGTGAAPVIAEICMEKDILTVAVVTRPFAFEGRHRSRLATEGIKALQDRTDTLIVIPNQNLFKLVDQSTTMLNSFGLADDVLLAGVKSITDLMVRPGLINLDFADVRSVMSGMGNALMGTGVAEGPDRATKAATDALRNPLLGGDMTIRSAKGLLVNITGGSDLTLFEVDVAAQQITSEIEDENANIIFGSSFDPSLEGFMRVSVVATGIDQQPQ